MTTIGKDTRIIPPCYIGEDVLIGANNTIGPFASIGAPPEHWEHYRTQPQEKGVTVIGDNNVIREFATINAPMGSHTTIGCGCFLMRGSHVAHDCVLGDKVTFSPGAKTGGHTNVDECATLGINSSVHQYSTIGAYSMIGMGGIVTKDIPPFLVYKNYECYRVNHVGMLRHGFTETDVKEVKDYYLSGWWRFFASQTVTDHIRHFYNVRNENRKICAVTII